MGQTQSLLEGPLESGGKMVASKCFYVRNRDGKDAVEIAKKRALEYIADIQGEATLTSKCRPELYNDDDDDDDDDDSPCDSEIAAELQPKRYLPFKGCHRKRSRLL